MTVATSQSTNDDTLTMTAHEEQSLRGIIEEKPRSVKTMARLSCLLAHRANKGIDTSEACNDRLEAIQWARKAIAVNPDLPGGYAALSIASVDYEERISALEKSIERSSTAERGPRYMTPAASAGAHVRLLVDPRDYEGKQLRKTRALSTIDPSHPSRRRLNETESDHYGRVVEALQFAYGCNDQSEYVAKLDYRLGLFFRKMNPIGEYRPIAMAHFRSAILQAREKSEMVGSSRFWLATLEDHLGDGTSMSNIDRCPAHHVVSLYSTFVERYDDLMVEKLRYKTPMQLRRLVDKAVGHAVVKTAWAKRAVDLGCGTGLSGEAFRDIVEHLKGVDLSPHMVERAQRRNCYDDLHVGELSVVLADPTNPFDLIFSCDVFVYIGNLAETFSRVKMALRPDGLFAFSTEFLEESMAGSKPYVLRPCARFAHKKSYVEKLLLQANMSVAECYVSPIRKNGGEDVAGMLVVAKHTPTDRITNCSTR